jgi:hypothetical protein
LFLPTLLYTREANFFSGFASFFPFVVGNRQNHKEFAHVGGVEYNEAETM